MEERYLLQITTKCKKRYRHCWDQTKAQLILLQTTSAQWQDFRISRHILPKNSRIWEDSFGEKEGSYGRKAQNLKDGVWSPDEHYQLEKFQEIATKVIQISKYQYL